MAQWEASEEPVKSKGGAREGKNKFLDFFCSNIKLCKGGNSSGESENSHREPYAETITLRADR